jgi:hypothetical protein
MKYSEFLNSKAASDIPTGFEPAGIKLNRPAFDFQRDVVNWAVRRGRAALFEDCGLGKTVQQLAWAQEILPHAGKVLILAPLAVADQTIKEGEIIGVDVKRAAGKEDIDGDGIYITNYAKLHRFDPTVFGAVVLDESSILKSYDGATRKLINESFQHCAFKLACTATPAPNDLIELTNHAEFLGVMSGKEIIALYFKQDGNTTHKWRLKGHAEQDFWKWVCSWAVNIRKPSDLGYDDGQFQLPPLHLHEHIVESGQTMDGYLFALPASSLCERRDARRASLSERVELAAELANSNDEPWVAWCNLNTESQALTKAIKGAVELTGSDTDERKEQVLRGFADGTFRRIVTKPQLSGFGLNWQHCAHELFVGLSDSYEQYYQALRRCYRFGQTREVNAHLVISNLEGAVLNNIKRKDADATRMAEQMVKHMAAISSQEIRGVRRNQASYEAKKQIKIPQWLTA